MLINNTTNPNRSKTPQNNRCSPISKDQISHQTREKIEAFKLFIESFLKF